MRAHELVAASEPTFYFIGVTTGQSSVNRVYPRWAAELGFSPALVGVDCELHDDPAVYRAIVDHIRSDELSVGGLITTHKLDLLAAARDRFDRLDPYAARLGEISCIAKRGPELHGSATDPISVGLALDAIEEGQGFDLTDVEVCILGAGGSALALTVQLLSRPHLERPKRIHVTNRSRPRLDEMRRIHTGVDGAELIEYHHAPSAEDNDVVVAGLSEGALVVNATGLGKDGPGSPLTDAVRFPRGAIAWDFNYRGKLRFLEQARAQSPSFGVRVRDGWVYFIHGWLAVIATVFELDIPTHGPAFDRLAEIAAEVRR